MQAGTRPVIASLHLLFQTPKTHFKCILDTSERKLQDGVLKGLFNFMIKKAFYVQGSKNFKKLQTLG